MPADKCTGHYPMRLVSDGNFLNGKAQMKACANQDQAMQAPLMSGSLIDTAAHPKAIATIAT